MNIRVTDPIRPIEIRHPGPAGAIEIVAAGVPGTKGDQGEGLPAADAAGKALFSTGTEVGDAAFRPVETADVQGLQDVLDTMSASFTAGLVAEQQAREAGINGLNTIKADKTYVDQRFTDLIGDAPGLLDTLSEIADAIADDENFGATIIAQLAGKADLSGATFTGAVGALSYGLNSWSLESVSTALDVKRAGAAVLSILSNKLRFRNDGGFTWAANTNPTGAVDLGFDRDGPGVGKMTDGGAGLAKFKASQFLLNGDASRFQDMGSGQIGVYVAGSLNAYFRIAGLDLGSKPLFFGTAAGASDAAIAREASELLNIRNGAANALADLKLRNLFVETNETLDPELMGVQVRNAALTYGGVYIAPTDNRELTIGLLDGGGDPLVAMKRFDAQSIDWKTSHSGNERTIRFGQSDFFFNYRHINAGYGVWVGTNTNAGDNTRGNTGLSLLGTDILQFHAGGNVGMYLRSTGRLGIGTMSPAHKVHVNDVAGIPVKIGLGDAGLTRLELGYAFTEHITPNAMQAQIKVDTSGSLIIAPRTNWGEAHLRLFTADDALTGIVERVRLQRDGKLGIGTISPFELLHVNGRVKVGGSGANGGNAQLHVAGETANSGILSSNSAGGVLIGYGGATVQGRGVNGVGNTHLKLQTHDGSTNVAIGNITPEERLHVDGNIRLADGANVLLKKSASSSYVAALRFLGAAGSGSEWGMAGSYGQALEFRLDVDSLSNLEYFRITRNANVSQQTMLEVDNAGNLKLPLSDNSQVKLGAASDAGFGRDAAGVGKATDGGSGLGAFKASRLLIEANEAIDKTLMGLHIHNAADADHAGWSLIHDDSGYFEVFSHKDGAAHFQVSESVVRGLRAYMDVFPSVGDGKMRIYGQGHYPAVQFHVLGEANHSMAIMAYGAYDSLFYDTGQNAHINGAPHAANGHFFRTYDGAATVYRFSVKTDGVQVMPAGLGTAVRAALDVYGDARISTSLKIDNTGSQGYAELVGSGNGIQVKSGSGQNAAYFDHNWGYLPTYLSLAYIQGGSAVNRAGMQYYSGGFAFWAGQDKSEGFTFGGYGLADLPAGQTIAVKRGGARKQVLDEGNLADIDFSGLPTADPAVVGRAWNDAGTIKISAGP